MSNSENIKDKAVEMLEEALAATEKLGDLNFFEVNIKIINRDIIMNLAKTYKEKV